MIQYIFFSFLFCIIAFFIYIKLAYPFWNNQPVFHVYDYWRYFYSTPFVVYKYRPVKNKFCDFINIKTVEYLESNDDQRKNIIELLQCYYFGTDRILHNIQLDDVNIYLSGHNEPAYVSIYNENKYQLINQDHENMFGKKNIDVMSTLTPIGCITSRPMKLFFRTNKTDIIYNSIPIYYIDFICVHRNKNEHNKKKINRTLLQTHEYNQRIKNPSILVSIIKKEIDLFDGIVPLVEFNVYTFYLRSIHFPRLPPHFEVVQINDENTDILLDFLHIKEKTAIETKLGGLEIMVIPDIGNIIALIKQRLLYVYVLRKKTDVYGVYFIKDAKMQFDDIEGNTLQCIGSINQMLDANPLFYLGFLHGLHKIIKRDPEYKMLLFENIGHNTILLNYWKVKHTPIFVNKTAYYTYNFIYLRSPISNEK